MSKKRREVKRVGAVRPSQLMYAYGVGSVVDLPNFSVIVSGIDDWDETRQDVIPEPRLLDSIRAQNPGFRTVSELRGAPWEPETPNAFDSWAFTGVPVFPFPRWLRCNTCYLVSPIDSGLFKLDHTNPYRPDWARYVHGSCSARGRPPTAVPSRFIVACPKGHVDEFPWIEFCHKDSPCTGAPLVDAIDIGSATRSTNVLVRCRTCGAENRVSVAFGQGAEKVLPRCRGRHAHLRRFDEDGCDQQVTAMLLGASNSWFPVTASALSIPTSQDNLEQLTSELWAELDGITDRSILDYALGHNSVIRALQAFDAPDVWAAIEEHRASAAEGTSGEVDLVGPEWAVFSDPDHAPSGRDFQLRDSGPPAGFEDRIETVIQVERLREVVAMLGFTRIDGPDSGVAEDAVVPWIAPIARKQPDWLPATEIRGEGLFIRLPEDSVVEWEEAASGTPRLDDLHKAHQRWRARRNLDAAAGWPGERYVLLHSIAHALINELALECGYASASIRERIYARQPGGDKPPMAGILLYTAAPDSEGTLGGLISLGEPAAFGRILGQMIDRSRLCASDPHCAEHTPDEDEDVLHGAACHACLFVPETSCTRGNRYLERSTVVPTLATAGIAYLGA